MQAPPPTVLCFKCGHSGHWSRDCTLAPSQWQTKPAEAPAARPAPPPAPSTPAANRTSTQGTPAHRSGEFGGYSRGTDAQRPGEGPLQQRPKGCYKCGKSGHWARDCDAPPDQQLPRGTFPSGNMESAAPFPSADAGKAVPAAKKKPAKKPRKRKITFEDLKEKDAIAEVFYEFPKRFARKFKGKGHEVSDLRRLLEMYALWAEKHFPLHSFDEAMDQIADLGKSNRLKVELREMRQNVLKVMQDEPAAPQGEAAQQDAVAGGGPAAEALPAEGTQGGSGPAAWDDDEDDELVNLQQQGWAAQVEAVPMDMLEEQLAHGTSMQAGGAGQTARQRQTDTDMEPAEGEPEGLSAEDEALLALAQEEDPPSQAGGAKPPGGSCRAAAPATDEPLTEADVELLALAEAPLPSQAAGLPDQAGGAADEPMTEADVELLALAEAPLPSQADALPDQAGGAAAAEPLSEADAELLALAEAPLPSKAAGLPDQAGGAGDVHLTEADVELLALAAEGPSQAAGADAAPRAARPPVQAGGAGDAQHAGALSAEDEELLALAQAPLSQVADESPSPAGPPAAASAAPVRGAVAPSAGGEGVLAPAAEEGVLAPVEALPPPPDAGESRGVPVPEQGFDAEGGPAAQVVSPGGAHVVPPGSGRAGQAAASVGIPPAEEPPAKEAQGPAPLAAAGGPASLLQGAHAGQSCAAQDGPEMGQAAAWAPAGVGGNDADDNDEELLALL